MYGAILGDIIGSPYEFDRGNKTKDFPLFSGRSEFTDDTVMTIAVADAFLPVQPDMEDDTIRQRGLSQRCKSMAVSILMRVMADGSVTGSGIGIRSLTTAGATALPCVFPPLVGCTMIWKLCAGWRDSLQK